MKNILLIEEQPLAVIVVRSLIESLFPGYNIVHRLSAEEVGESERYSLVFTDLYGYTQQQVEAVEAICQQFFWEPKIFLTGNLGSDLEAIVLSNNSLLISRDMMYSDIVDQAGWVAMEVRINQGQRPLGQELIERLSSWSEAAVNSGESRFLPSGVNSTQGLSVAEKVVKWKSSHERWMSSAEKMNQRAAFMKEWLDRVGQMRKSEEE